MSTRKDGGQAFPSEFFETEHGDRVEAFAGSPGMALRDWFAGQAMAGILANPHLGHAPEKRLAELAYRQADALIAARVKGGE